jgi:hypothetical protein
MMTAQAATGEKAERASDIQFQKSHPFNRGRRPHSTST